MKIGSMDEISHRGYFGIGILNHTKDANIGTLMRSAFIYGASYIFTIGSPYSKSKSDTTKSWRHIPLFQYADIEDFWNHIPLDASVIGIEINAELAVPLTSFQHPQKAIYLLGPEGGSLTEDILMKCNDVIFIPHGKYCLNVSVAGSIVMYDRKVKING